MVRRRCVAAACGLALLAPLVFVAQPASAFPKGAPVLTFNYKVIASTHIKKLNQTITPPQGRFKGAVNLKTQKLEGHIKLPPVKFTFSQAGIPLMTATAQIVEAKPVTGTLKFATLKVTATSTFNLRIIDAHASPGLPGVGPLPVPPVNLVGDKCTTAKPISVTMSGKANLGGKSTFSGSFTIPNFKTCGALTTVLNQLIPGPGNTFTATAIP
jgi:hypothetical protein